GCVMGWMVLSLSIGRVPQHHIRGEGGFLAVLPRPAQFSKPEATRLPTGLRKRSLDAVFFGPLDEFTPAVMMMSVVVPRALGRGGTKGFPGGIVPTDFPPSPPVLASALNLGQARSSLWM